MSFDSAATATLLHALHERTQAQRAAVDAISPQTNHSGTLALQLLALETAYMNAAEAMDALLAITQPVIPVPLCHEKPDPV